MSYGGSLSGEHGDGQARGELLSRMFEPELMDAFREFKSIWDPDWRMNPGKVIDAYPVLSNLRIGEGYNPPRVETHFKFPKDKYTFSRAALRCVGVGNCRRDEGGVMCPSYMVTREEMHSTRGRRTVALGDAERRAEGPTAGKASRSRRHSICAWPAKAVRAIAPSTSTWRRTRPSSCHTIIRDACGRETPTAWDSSTGGLGWRPSPPGSPTSSARRRLLRDVAKLVGGIDQRRSMPPFATETFKDWFFRRPFAGSRTSIGR